jgi:N6-L-threonylcarbamoyladenine synthase
MLHSDDFDFSFSGLKTAVFREVKELKTLDEQTIADIALETENAIVDVLVTKTIKAVQKYHVKSLLLGGGVAANQKLKQTLATKIEDLQPEISFHIPPPFLCTDNAAMIGAAGIYKYQEVPWVDLSANPDLYFD